MRIGLQLLFQLTLFLILLGTALATANKAIRQPVSILITAITGVEEGYKEWQPTIDYLQAHLPEFDFQLTPVEPNKVERMKTLIDSGNIDFVITQPAIYVDLELSQGVSKVLTLEKQKGMAEFGSVLITLPGNGLHSLGDMKNKRVVGVAPLGFGGWLIGYNEMLEAGFDPYKQARSVAFVGNQKKVVSSVLNGAADLGVIRTGILEKMIAAGEVQAGALHIINEKQYARFSKRISTQLYPEWAFARTNRVSNDTTTKVAQALLEIPAGSYEARSARYWRWVMPYSYQSVHNLMRNLKVGPYVNYGKITFQEFVRQHFLTVSIVILLSLVVFILSLVVLRSNRLLASENEQKLKALEKMRHMASYDELTQLPNRRLFFELLSKAVEQSSRERFKTAVLYLDLDGFKQINDTYGHQVGDKVLAQAAKIIQGCVRKCDTAARIGGDEFTCLMTNIKSREIVEQVIARIINEIPKASNTLKAGSGLGITIGALLFGPAPGNVDQLLKQADDLMYEAKKSNKGGFILKDISQHPN